MRENQRLDAQNPNRENRASTVPLWRQIRWNLILSFVLLTVLSMIIIVLVIFFQTSRQATAQARNQLESIVELKSEEIKRWLDNSRSTLSLALANRTRRDLFVAFATLTLSGNLLPEDQLVEVLINNLLSEAAQAQTVFEELFLYNTEGLIVASSAPVQMGKVVIGQPYFSQSLGGDFVQTPYYEIGRGELTMFITHRLVDREGETVGVLAGRLDLRVLSEIMTERAGLEAANGETYLVSRENNYLVTPSRFEDEGYVLTRKYTSEGINLALDGQNGSGVYDNYRTPPVQVIGVYRWLPELQVAMLAEADEAAALASFTQAQNLSFGLAALTMLGAVMVGLYSATRISRPITVLTQVATQIAAGDLRQRADVIQRNEIGVLATAFNHMTDQLQEAIGRLEERVADRTQRLEVMANLSERLNAILDYDQLLAELVDQVTERFEYYHAHVYIIDEAGQDLVVAAGAGEAGQKMKAEGHKIPLAARTSLVARAARTGQVVTVENVRETEDWLPNPLLPHTFSEMAIPIILNEHRNDRVVGVLDVQEDKIAGLDESDASLLRSLAGQVAVAIRNARLFAQVETALAEAQQAQERYLQQSWQAVSQRKERGRYYYQRPGLPGLREETTAQLEAAAMQQSEPRLVFLNDEDQPQDQGEGNQSALGNNSALVAPIRLQNHAIGAIQLYETEQPRQWSDQEVALVQAVADQMAQAAENLRLFEETQARASQEQTIREITERLRQASSLEALAKITGEALGEALGLSHSLVKFGATRGNESMKTNGNEA